MKNEAAWVDVEALDTESVARISYLMAPALFEMRICNRACISSLAFEATAAFQALHFSFDSIYWDNRNYPETIAAFVESILEMIRAEPEWLNQKYVTAQESLVDLLFRHSFAAEYFNDDLVEA